MRKSPLIHLQTEKKLVNLTNMWKAEKADKNKQPYEWLRLPNTVEFVDYIKKTLNTGIIPVLAVKGRYGGTYAHRAIARPVTM